MKRIAQLGSDFFAIMLLAALLAWISYGLSRPLLIDEVSLQTALSWGENALWLDARTKSDYQAEHIPGALSLHMDHWQQDIPAVQSQAVDKEKIVVYCYSASCNSALLMARRLYKEVGLTNVVIMHGGWESWQQERP